MFRHALVFKHALVFRHALVFCCLLTAARDSGAPIHPSTHQQITQALSVSGVTISAICRRFVLEGRDAALYERARPGQVPKITGKVEAQLVLLACSEPPPGQARWTMQLLAHKLVELQWVESIMESISDSAVCERLKKARSSRGRSSGSAWASLRHSM